MLTQYGIKLAVHIITNDFGKLVAQVCECLLRRGSLTKSGIARFAEIPLEKVKKCLWVLIQHNCVQAFTFQQQAEHGKPELVNTHYMALLDNIIQRIRFSKFLAITAAELDQHCAVLLEGLLQHGRLTLTQILDRDTQDAGSDADPNAVRERFFLLVSRRFVEHCPAPAPNVVLPSEEDNGTKKKGAKSSKTTVKEVSLEELALAAAVPMEAERFSIDDVTSADTIDETNRKSLAVKTGEKRKLNLTELEPLLDDVCSEKEPIWRVNFDEFKRRLRNKACIETIRTRLDNNAGKVLSAMLKAIKSTESTVSVSLEAIFEELLRSNQTTAMTLNHVRSILDDIGCDSQGDAYSIDLSKIIKQAKNEEIESIVLKRYGRETYRVFRLLRTGGRALDTDKVSDRCFLEKKATTKILYQLWKDNFLLMEKLSMNGTKDVLLWKANDDNLFYEVLDEMYHAVLNLQIRSNHEKDQRRELLQMNKEALTPELQKRFDRLKQTMVLLVNCMMKLDDAILLFQD